MRFGKVEWRMALGIGPVKKGPVFKEQLGDFLVAGHGDDMKRSPARTGLRIGVSTPGEQYPGDSCLSFLDGDMERRHSAAVIKVNLQPVIQQGFDLIYQALFHRPPESYFF